VDALKALIDAILKSHNVELRLRARIEFRKRARRIDFHFRDGVLKSVQVYFVNGVRGLMVMSKGEAILVKLGKQPLSIEQMLDGSTTVTF
jgi:hypothetical protein